MKLLFLDSPAFAKQDMLDAFTDCGLSYDLFIHEGYHDRKNHAFDLAFDKACLLYTSPSPRDAHESRMPSSA